jgi:hypothetical protein
MGGSPQVITFRSNYTSALAAETGPVVGMMGSFTDGLCLVNVTAISGGAPNFTVFLQTTFPDGTVDDYAAFPTLAATGKSILAFGTRQAPIAAHAPRDGTIAAPSIGAGSFGNNLRVKALLTGGGSVTYSLTCQMSGR